MLWWIREDRRSVTLSCRSNFGYGGISTWIFVMGAHDKPFDSWVLGKALSVDASFETMC